MDTVVRAQQTTMPVIGIVGAASAEVMGVQLNLAAFREGLRETGFVEGQNVVIEYRWAELRLDRLPALAAELVARKVDAIVAAGGTALAAKNATSTIPIVFAVGTDPVADGLVASLNRPGGNLTGISTFNLKLMPKRLELLSELLPQAKVLALLAGRVEDWRAGLGRCRATFPAPSTSNAACGFPALRSPICFTSRLIGPILPGRLSACRVALDSR